MRAQKRVTPGALRMFTIKHRKISLPPSSCKTVGVFCKTPA